jgi:RNA-dependent RNA polymerase
MADNQQIVIEGFNISCGIFMQNRRLFRPSTIYRGKTMTYFGGPKSYSIQFFRGTHLYRMSGIKIKEVHFSPSNGLMFLTLLKKPEINLRLVDRDNKADKWVSDVNPFFETEEPFMDIILPHHAVFCIETTRVEDLVRRFGSSNRLDIEVAAFPLEFVNQLLDLNWDVRYSIFVLITHNLLDPGHLTQANIDMFKQSNADRVQFFLYLLYRNKRKFSEDYFRQNITYCNPPRLENTDEILFSRRVIVTPYSYIYQPKEREENNRVIRGLRGHEDCFLRVEFGGEGSYSNHLSLGITRRYKRILEKFFIAGKQFEFLGCSSSQLKSRTVWMVEVKQNFNGQLIRKSLGDFSTLTHPGKYLARLGQCFSSTRCAYRIPSDVKVREIDDVERNGYKFTDGIGLISRDIMDEIKILLRKPDEPICALQVRLSGCKGMLVILEDPNIKKTILVRKSMIKFYSPDWQIEICAISKYNPAKLNKQVIFILDELQTEKEVFYELIDSYIYSYIKEFNIQRLREKLNSLNNHLAKSAARFISYNYEYANKDIYISNLKDAFYNNKVHNFRTTFRIPVPDTAFLMGVVDETGTLEYGQVFIRICRNVEAPEAERRYEVVTGDITVTKNPCYHAGDIRILKGVDIPALHYLVNVVVFPQKGKRPHTNEIAGSDLDGDTYFVSWYERLLPKIRNLELNQHDVFTDQIRIYEEICLDDVLDFYLKSLNNFELGKISNLHLAYADKYGINHPNSVLLSQAYTIALDFAKTGLQPDLPKEVQNVEYPNYMEHMGKSRESTSVLGNIYKTYRLIDFNLKFEIEICYLLPGYDVFIPEAQKVYERYVKLIKNMIQEFKVPSEFMLVIEKIHEKKR